MTAESATTAKDNSAAMREFLTFFVDGQLLGIDVLQVQDVLSHQKVTRVPLAPPEVEGSLNLRGRIVTAINLRKRLGISKPATKDTMSVVIDYKGDLYSLTVDTVGEVLSLPVASAEQPPVTLEPLWRQHAVEIYRLEGSLLVVLDVTGMFDALSRGEGEHAA